MTAAMRGFRWSIVVGGLALILGAAAMLRTATFSRLLGWWGVVTAVLGLIGMFRNVTGAVAAVADVNNYLLPLWMVGFGVALARHGWRRKTGDVQAEAGSPQPG